MSKSKCSRYLYFVFCLARKLHFKIRPKSVATLVCWTRIDEHHPPGRLSRRYVLGTDGRGWARPVEGKRSVGGGVAVARTEDEVAAAGRCGGVDGGPYGLQRQRWQRSAVDGVDVPFFDNQTRPHSVVVPWRPARPVLFGVRDSGCHRALFDHCAGAVPRRPADALHDVATIKRVRALRSWVDAAVLPLVTPAAATGRWYPALWGASLAARRLEQATVAVRVDDGNHPSDAENMDYPNVNFYAFVVLVSAFLCWTAALCTLFRDWLRSALAQLLRTKRPVAKRPAAKRPAAKHVGP